jgi:hypothetical protein
LSGPNITGALRTSASAHIETDNANQAFSVGVEAAVSGASATITTTGGKVYVSFDITAVYLGAGTALFRLWIDGAFSTELCHVTTPASGASGGGSTITAALAAGSHTFAIYLLNSSGASQLLQYNTHSLTVFEIGT